MECSSISYSSLILLLMTLILITTKYFLTNELVELNETHGMFIYILFTVDLALNHTDLNHHRIISQKLVCSIECDTWNVWRLNSTIEFVWVPATCKPKTEKREWTYNFDIGVVPAKVTPTPKLVQLSNKRMIRNKIERSILSIIYQIWIE